MPITADNHGAEVLGDALRRAGYLIDSSSLPGGFRGKNVWALLTREGRPATAIIYPPGKAFMQQSAANQGDDSSCSLVPGATR